MLKLKKTIKTEGFTLAELVTAVAILAMLAGFLSVIFKSSIDGYRSAGANTEIMQKFRAITEQLNTDFEGICKDGYLIIRIEQKPSRKVYPELPDEREDFYMDRIYYFTTGDFQSWEDANIKSNIARIFWGHDSNSLNDDIPLSMCSLARDIVLLTPEEENVPYDDCRNVSFAQTKNEPNSAYLVKLVDPNESQILDDNGSVLVVENDPDLVRRLMCKNIGEFKIEWCMGKINPATGEFVWYSDDVTWGPNDTKPKAIKFTFTLYDSKGILQGGRRFTHIVYLDS